jgi:hypothetical protein
MASPTEVSPPTDDPRVTTDQPKNSRPRPSRLNQALAWVGIVAGGLFIAAAIFFSGFFLSWSFDGPWGEHMAPGPMACCSQMKPGEQMMKPDEHMKPGAMMGPGGEATPGAQMPAPGMMSPGSQMMPGEMMPGRMMGPGGTTRAITSPTSPRP